MWCNQNDQVQSGNFSDCLSNNILWMKKHQQYLRQQRADVVNNLLRTRPSREHLINMHILIEKMCDEATENAPSVFSNRQELRNLLCEHLKNRPTLTNLIKNQILKPTIFSEDRRFESSAENNSVNYLANCASMVSNNSNDPTSMNFEETSPANLSSTHHFPQNNSSPHSGSKNMISVMERNDIFYCPRTDTLFQKIGNSLVPYGKLVAIAETTSVNPNPNNNLNNSPSGNSNNFYMPTQPPPPPPPPIRIPKQKTYNFHEFSPETFPIKNSLNSTQTTIPHTPSNVRFRARSSLGNSQKLASQSHNLISSSNQVISNSPHTFSISNTSRNVESNTNFNKFSNNVNNGTKNVKLPSSDNAAISYNKQQFQQLIDEHAKSLEKQIMQQRHIKLSSQSRTSMCPEYSDPREISRLKSMECGSKSSPSIRSNVPLCHANTAFGNSIQGRSNYRNTPCVENPTINDHALPNDIIRSLLTLQTESTEACSKTMMNCANTTNAPSISDFAKSGNTLQASAYKFIHKPNRNQASKSSSFASDLLDKSHNMECEDFGLFEDALSPTVKYNDQIETTPASSIVDPFSSVIGALDEFCSSGNNVHVDSVNTHLGNNCIFNNNFSSDDTSTFSDAGGIFSNGSTNEQHRRNRTQRRHGGLYGLYHHQSTFSSTTSTSLFSDTSEFASPSSLDLDFLIDPYVPFPSVSEKVALYELISHMEGKLQSSQQQQQQEQI